MAARKRARAITDSNFHEIERAWVEKRDLHRPLKGSQVSRLLADFLLVFFFSFHVCGMCSVNLAAGEANNEMLALAEKEMPVGACALWGGWFVRVFVSVNGKGRGSAARAHVLIYTNSTPHLRMWPKTRLPSRPPRAGTSPFRARGARWTPRFDFHVARRLPRRGFVFVLNKDLSDMGVC